MENNHLINKINSIIMAGEETSETQLSLVEFITLIEKIEQEIIKLCKETIKKINKKMSSNFAFFDHVATTLKVNGNIDLTLECNVIREKVTIDRESLKITSKIKNKEVLESLINEELTELIEEVNKYNYLEKLKIKTTFNDLNVNITPEFVEVFAYKSPNWITMGKSFSLRYLFASKKYEYETDRINLKEVLHQQEKLLYSKIKVDLNLLSNELKEKYEYYKNNHEEIEHKENFITKIINKIRNLMKKY